MVKPSVAAIIASSGLLNKVCNHCLNIPLKIRVPYYNIPLKVRGIKGVTTVSRFPSAVYS
jgi:hypothetical protein